MPQDEPSDRLKEFGVDDMPDELTVAQAVAVGIRLQRVGQAPMACQLFERVLKVEPEHPDAWHFLGVARYQCGEREQGLDAIRRALQINPDNASAQGNLANMLFDRGQHDEAEQHLLRSLELDPKAEAPRITLAIIRRVQGRCDEAMQLLEQVLAQNPQNAAAHQNIARLLFDAKRVAEGMDHTYQAIAIEPAFAGGARQMMGRALCAVGRFEEAAKIYRDWLAEEPEHPTPAHLLAACGGVAAPARAADDYVRKTFDSFAASFDVKLAALEYRAPELIAQAFARSLPPDAPSKPVVLDAGCGTGLMADHLRAHCASLVGVDLSRGMLQQARARGGYDELHEAELTEFMDHAGPRFDAITCADTLCYFGALEAVVAAARNCLRPGGWFIFTVEHDPDPQVGHRLQFHGRYAHGRDYVEKSLLDAGFDAPTLQPAELRRESGRPVAGLVVSARRPVT